MQCILQSTKHIPLQISQKHIHIVNDNVYKKYIYISHTAKDIFTDPGTETTFVVLVTPLSCKKCLHTEGVTLTTV